MNSLKASYVDAAFIASATSVFYYVTQDELLKGLALPAVGLVVQKIGTYCASRGIENIGQAMVFGGVFPVPGLAVGMPIYILGGKNVVAGMIGFGSGVFATHKAFDYVIKWAAEQAVPVIP